MSDYQTPSRCKHSVSSHVNLINPKQNLPKILSFYSKSPSVLDISDKKIFHTHDKSLNLLQFKSLFNSEGKILQEKQKSKIRTFKKNEEVFLTNFSLNVNDFLKLCNKEVILNNSKMKEKHSNSTILNKISKNEPISFNELRKRAFKINKILNYSQHIVNSNEKINNNFHIFLKNEHIERKSNENHINKIEKGREIHNEKIFSDEKEKEFFNKIRKSNLNRINKIHQEKLHNIKNYAGIIEKEVSFQNRNFKGLFNEFAEKFHTALTLKNQ